MILKNQKEDFSKAEVSKTLPLKKMLDFK